MKESTACTSPKNSCGQALIETLVGMGVLCFCALGCLGLWTQLFRVWVCHNHLLTNTRKALIAIESEQEFSPSPWNIQIKTNRLEVRGKKRCGSKDHTITFQRLSSAP